MENQTALYPVYAQNRELIARITVLNPEKLQIGAGIAMFKVNDGWKELGDLCFNKKSVLVEDMPANIVAFPSSREGIGYVQLVDELSV